MALDKFGRLKNELWKKYLEFELTWSELLVQLDELEQRRQEYYK